MPIDNSLRANSGRCIIHVCLNILWNSWEERRTASGRIQYLNHITRTTQWERPTRYNCTHAHMTDESCRILEKKIDGSFQKAKIISSIIFYCLSSVQQLLCCKPQQTWPYTKKAGAVCWSGCTFLHFPFQKKKLPLSSTHNNNSLSVMSELLSVSLAPHPPATHTHIHTN